MTNNLSTLNRILKNKKKDLISNNNNINEINKEIQKTEKEIFNINNNIVNLSLEIENNNLLINKHLNKINRLDIKNQELKSLKIIILLITLFLFNINRKREDEIEIETFSLNRIKLLLNEIENNHKNESKKLDLKNIIIKKLKQEYKELHSNISNIKKDIVELEYSFQKKINIFKNDITDFFLKIPNNIYVDGFLENEILHYFNQKIKNDIQFISYPNLLTSDIILEINKYNQNPKEYISLKNNIYLNKEKNNRFFDSIESNPLTLKQREAVLINDKANLILAGAGSGKTSVIIAKVIYMIQNNMILEKDVLILAFNKKAKEELEYRFKEKKYNINIQTFHSFGLYVIGEVKERKPDLCPIVESDNNMKVFLEKTCKEIAFENPEFLNQFVEHSFFNNIPEKSKQNFQNKGEQIGWWKTIVNFTYKVFTSIFQIKNELDETKQRLEDFKSNPKIFKEKDIIFKNKYYSNEEIELKLNQKIEELKQKLTTLQFETVKSQEELKISNFLTLNGIEYEYEKPYEYKTYTKNKRQYKPDFYLPEYNIYLEHFGIDKDGNTAPYINKEEYHEGIKWKRELHKQNNTKLIETYSYEISNINFKEILSNKLKENNVILKEISNEEKMKIIDFEIKELDFFKIFMPFLSHFRANNLNIDTLKRQYKTDSGFINFLNIFEKIYQKYNEYKIKNCCVDFDDMIEESNNLILKNKYINQFKHIFIDEFQDISTNRFSLVKHLLNQNNGSLTVVGDDWQSIYEFAGSNISIIENFMKDFKYTKRIDLDYSFRFNDTIADSSSYFIQKNPKQLKKIIKTIKKEEQRKTSLNIYWSSNNKDSIQNTILDIENIIKHINKKDKTKKHVMLLARYNFEFEGLDFINHKYPDIQFSFLTIHKSKGLEADYVILLNVNISNKYGFPSRVIDHQFLKKVMTFSTNYPDEEERRLFYVALTRTKKEIYLRSEYTTKSPFINELINDFKNKITFFNISESEIIHCPECIQGVLKKREKKNFKSEKDRFFYGCSNYSFCEYTENIHYCPECNSELYKDIPNNIAKCSNHSCYFRTKLCSRCHHFMVERTGKFGKFLGCYNYPNCTFTLKIEN